MVGTFADAQTPIGPTLTNPRGLIIIDDYAYYLDNNRLERIDLNNPTSTEVVRAGLAWSPYTLESSINGFYTPNTGNFNVANTQISNGTVVSTNTNAIAIPSGRQMGFAFRANNQTYFTTNNSGTNVGELNQQLSGNNSQVIATLPTSGLNILDVAVIGSEAYFAGLNGQVWYYNFSFPANGFSLFLNLGTMAAVTGLEVTQDFIYYAVGGNVVRRSRTTGANPTTIMSNLNINNVDIASSTVYGISRNTANDRLYSFVDPGLSNCTNIVNIPDANFKAALLDHGVGITNPNISVIDTDGDGEICINEAQAYTGYIFVDNKGISDLTGIEAFVNIPILACNDNNLTTIDISQNTAIKELVCGGNATFTTLDVSQNLALERIFCVNSGLTTLDVSNNSELNLLNLIGSNLTSLDLSNNPQLNSVLLTNNNLTSLNVANGNNGSWTQMGATGNPNLSCIEHDTGFDPTTNINWQKDASATWSDNCATSTCTTFVNIPDANFKAILVGDPSINTDGDNEICTTEAQAYTGSIFVVFQGISDLTGIEAFTNITELSCDENQLTSLDISANTALTTLSCSLNQLTSLDVSNNTLLTQINCGGNQLTSLDVSNNTALVGLFCSANQISGLDISANTNLEQLNCVDNQLTSLNVANTNNGNMTLMAATMNANLSCVQHDAGYDPTLNPNWQIDGITTWNTNCPNLSIGDDVLKNTFIVFPNPASSKLNIATRNNTVNRIIVYSLLGKEIFTTTNTVINVSALKNGIYLLKIEGENDSFEIKKFIKQ